MLQIGKIYAVLPTLFLSMSGFCLAETTSLSADDKKLLEACLKCHSSTSVAADPSIPQLAGQYPQYLQKQITEYFDNRRSGHEHAPFAKDMDEMRWKKITQAISQITLNHPSKPKSETIDLLVTSGENIYLNGDSATGALQCVQCHGPEGRGRSEKITLFPILANQNYAYLVTQLNRFKNSERTNDQAFMMRNVARTLSDEEITAVASYLAYLPASKEPVQEKAVAPTPQAQPPQAEAKPVESKVESKKEPAPVKEPRDKATAEQARKEAAAQKAAEKPMPPASVAMAKPLEKPAPLPAEAARSAPAGASSEMTAAINRGRDKAIVCEACHGPGGRSASAVNPSLAGQHAAYLEKQMKAYRSKQRHDAVMTSISESLSDRDIHDLSVYFANAKKK